MESTGLQDGGWGTSGGPEKSNRGALQPIMSDPTLLQPREYLVF